MIIQDVNQECKSTPTFEPIDKHSAEIKKDDILLLSTHTKGLLVKVEKVKVSKNDGVEVIYNIKKNEYFSFTMFLTKDSYVNSIYRLKYD